LFSALAISSLSVTGAPVLWNTLGSSSEVLNSAFGPNLNFYTGGTYPDVSAVPGYVSGVFGNALTIAPGPYSGLAREHNVIWNNVNNYLSADHGTISIWYKQNATPVGFSYGVYRIFDGAYGLGAGVGMDAQAATGTLNFGVQFGGTVSSVSYDVSAYNGTWIHLGGVWDRAGIDGSNDKVRLYINGSVVAANTFGGWGTVVGSVADIGGGNDDSIAGKFAIDNLQVFNTAMTDFSGRFVDAIPEPGVLSLVTLAGIGFWTRRLRGAKV
jgi:hypothetical protein